MVSEQKIDIKNFFLQQCAIKNFIFTANKIKIDFVAL